MVIHSVVHCIDTNISSDAHATYRRVPVIALYDEAVHGVTKVQALSLVGLGQVVGLVLVPIVHVQLELTIGFAEVREPLIAAVNGIRGGVVEQGSVGMSLQISTDGMRNRHALRGYRIFW